jgi:DNA invertase Pin-like site-specific DNA recombinase
VAIASFAKRASYELVGEYYDKAARGADALEARPGFCAMLRRIAGNGVHTIIVETANRFARDLIVQETGHRMLRLSAPTLVDELVRKYATAGVLFFFAIVPVR